MKGNINEQRTAAASYILNFYSEVMVLKQQTALYTNLVKRMVFKYGDLSKDSKMIIEKMDDAEKNALIESSQASAYQAQLTYFSYKSIMVNMAIAENKDTESLYANIKRDFIINPKDIEDFCININMFLLNNIVQELLSNSSQFVDSVFNDTSAKQ